MCVALLAGCTWGGGSQTSDDVGQQDDRLCAVLQPLRPVAVKLGSSGTAADRSTVAAPLDLFEPYADSPVHDSYGIVRDAARRLAEDPSASLSAEESKAVDRIDRWLAECSVS